MRTALVLRFSWMILGGSLAHHLARRALARTLRRQRLSRVHVGRPSGGGSGARISGRLLHENPKLGYILYILNNISHTSHISYTYIYNFITITITITIIFYHYILIL
jgi:hypothetical protein